MDLRQILPDEEFNLLFPNGGDHKRDEGHLLANTVYSEWISSRTNLPIDFQVQKASEANATYKSQSRNAIGG